MLVIIIFLLIIIILKPGIFGNVIFTSTPSSLNYQPKQNVQSPPAQQLQQNLQHQDNYNPIYNSGSCVTGSAVINPPFYANAWNVKAGNPGIINLELKNNGGEDYVISSIEITGDSNINCATGRISKIIETGSTQTFTIACENKLRVGETYKGGVMIYYTKSRNSFELTSTGSIAEKVIV